MQVHCCISILGYKLCDKIVSPGNSGAVFAVKLYPAGATTNSQDGVTDVFGKCLPVLEEMVKQEMPLLVSYCYIIYYFLDE